LVKIKAIIMPRVAIVFLSALLPLNSATAGTPQIIGHLVSQKETGSDFLF
jgi:hypothetical protein